MLRIFGELRCAYAVDMVDKANGDDAQTYRAAHPGLRVGTYFMMYANSAEEQRYLSHIRRERESFERLIKERSVRDPQ